MVAKRITPRVRICFVGGPNSFVGGTEELIRSLQRECFSEIYEPVQGNYWWIAMDGNTPAGFCGLHQYVDQHQTAFLALCGVRKKYRGRGLQRRMIRTRIAKARKLGATRLISYCSTDNSQSANNLIRSGFEVYVPKWIWGRHDSVYFRRFI